MGEISAASEEKSDGIAQISQAITQIDQGTQESSAAMHTYNRSTESLQRETLALSHSAQAFLSKDEIQALREGSGYSRSALTASFQSNDITSKRPSTATPAKHFTANS
ncbi:MAG: hypothetical protein ACLFSR_09015 [Halomonas sp.]